MGKARKSILLVEPGYRNKYPPLGLMKISAFHKDKGDHVEFVKGLSYEKRYARDWDRIYVSSLFTFDWVQTIKTLRFYRYAVKPPTAENLVVGGVLATLLPDEVIKEVNCRVVRGLIDQPGKLGYQDEDRIDSILPDYSILGETDYKYPASNAYLAYATRGCIRRCEFCAVPRIEPCFKHHLPFAEQIREVEERYGPRRDLLLLDNNVLASNELPAIVDEIKKAGFQKGAVFQYRGRNNQVIRVRRSVDFNQGLDIRLLTEERMQYLSEIALFPVRLAFDSIALKNTYEEKMRLAAKYGFKRLSNYVLFNYTDTPADLYNRLRINLDLNVELGLEAYSFPMRYIHIGNKNRSADTPGNMGKHWNRKYLRAIQTILTPTHGVVSQSLEFFEKAFGRNENEFQRILLMPEGYIAKRLSHERDGSTERWWKQMCGLTSTERNEVLAMVYRMDFQYQPDMGLSKAQLQVLEHYRPNGRNGQLSFSDLDARVVGS